MLYKTFDYVMRKLGRKYAFVDVYGDVLSYRYYVFFTENKVAKTWKDKYLPNLFVHHFVGAENKQWVDNEVSHTHPWNTVSIVIKGGYIEEENYSGVTKEINAPAIVPRNWESSHRFVQVTPNTWTLWFHGIRKREGKWAFDMRPHDVVCSACIKHNNGVCINVRQLKEIEDTPPKSAQSYKWREHTWMQCDDDFEETLAQRKKVLARAKTYIPATIKERYEIAKETLVKDLVRENAEVSKV